VRVITAAAVLEPLAWSRRAAQNRAVARRTLAVLLASVLVGGCGGHGSKARSATAPAVSAPAVSVSGPGRLIAIGGGRSLYLDCVGAGSPTVVLEAGLGGNSHNWSQVQPQLGRLTRTCAYDRAGIGSSLALPGVHDASAEIVDLERLLAHAHIGPPYVLVGHSYGGLLARLFAQAHPSEVAGIVLVDAMGRDQTRRELAIWPRSQAPSLRRLVAKRVRDGVDLASGEALATHVTSLGDTRLAVVTAGMHAAEWGHAPASLRHALDRQWATMQDELARLSGDHVHVIALRSDHSVQRADGQPLVVIRAVQAVVRAARARAPLPPCVQLFTGSDVRCES
jgi:pimeloyl-ACP methyl ester carboxylesterase